MVKAFVWKYIGSGLTHSYHDGGAAIAIAETEEEAKAIVLAGSAKPESVEFEGSPEVWDLASPPAKELYIFEDAGCC